MNNDLSQALQAEVAEALTHKQTLAIIGGNSKRFLQPANADKTLHLADHKGIIDYQPSELYITARAGTPLDVIEALLAQHHQILGSEPPHFSHCSNKATLGGVIACGFSGSRRPFSGSLRDHVLGVKILNGQGQILSFGGQVMKNVAGFDVSRLMVGARGTLGALLEITIKVIPKPEVETTLRIECLLQNAQQCMSDFARMSLPLSAMAWLEGAVIIRLQGTAQVVRNAQLKIRGDEILNSQEFWLDLREHTHPFFHSKQPLWRLSVPPATPLPIPENEVFIDWCGGLRWWHTDKSAEEVNNMANQAEGYIYLFRDIKPVTGPQPPQSLLPLHQHLKKAFDPYGVFNPGIMGASN
jgi:glycolate oxidase FAD binding subunit